MCLQVKITSPQLVTSGTNPTITINFGGRVAQLNPLLLYNLTGAGRTDVVYDVNNGVVLVTAYVDENQATDILYVPLLLLLTCDCAHVTASCSMCMTVQRTISRHLLLCSGVLVLCFDLLCQTHGVLQMHRVSIRTLPDVRRNVA